MLKKYLEDKEGDMSTIKIKQVKSRIGAPADQKRTLDALGLPIFLIHSLFLEVKKVQ